MSPETAEPQRREPQYDPIHDTSGAARVPSPEIAATFEAIADGVAIYGSDGRIVRYNAAMGALMGLGRRPRDGVSPSAKRLAPFDVRYPDGRQVPLDAQPVTRALRGETLTGANAVDLLLRTLDDRAVVVSVSAAPLRNEVGVVTGCVAVYRDVTERQRLQSELSESERRYQAMFEQAAVGIARVGLDGQWLEVNRRLCDIIGYDCDDLLKHTFQDITYPADLSADLDYIRQLLAGQIKTYSMEKRYIHSGGGLAWVNLTVSLVRDVRGDPLYFVSVIEDINARKLAEEERAHADERERVAHATAEALTTRLTPLQAITDVALAHLDLASLLDALLERVCAVMRVDNVAVLLPDAEGAALTIYSVHGPESQVAERVRVPVGQGVAGTIMATGRPLIVDDLRDSNAVNPFLRESLRSLLGVPLRIEGHVIGVLHVATVVPRQFTQDDVGLLELVADRIAQAITRARLFERSERERASAEALAAQLNAVLRTLPVSVAMADAQGELIAVNPAFYTVWGSNAPLVGSASDYHAYVGWRLGVRLGSSDWPMARALAGGEVVADEEIEIEGFDGSRKTLLVSAAPIRTPDGAVTGGVVTEVDITSRKVAEDALRQSEERLSTLISMLPQGIFLLSADGAQALYINQRWREYSGLALDQQADPAARASLVHPDDLARVAEIRQRAIQAGEPFSFELRYRRHDGVYRWHILRMGPVRGEHSEITAWYGSVSDIDDLKRAQADLQALNETLERRVEERTAQLQEANGELEAFAYSVSHDLRAPLRAMEGFAQALLDDFAQDLEPEAREYSERIAAAASRMDTLIADLLAYSRLSRSQLHLRPVALAPVIEQALATVESDIRATHASIEVSPSVADAPPALAKAPVLEQVLTNLLTNALKFTPPNEAPQIRLWVEARPADNDPPASREQSHQSASGWLRLWVEDNGIGIAPEHQERIFRVFERLHGVEQYPGTGIGLAIVRKGVERMGGRAGVESAPGAGSRFWIELRAASTPDERARADVASGPEMPEMPEMR